MPKRSKSSSESMETLRLTYSKLVRTTLLKSASKQVSSDQEKYFKNVIQFHGLKAPTLEKCWKETLKANLQEKFPNCTDQLELSYELMKSKYSEEKSIGVKVCFGMRMLLNLLDFIR